MQDHAALRAQLEQLQQQHAAVVVRLDRLGGRAGDHEEALRSRPLEVVATG